MSLSLPAEESLYMPPKMNIFDPTATAEWFVLEGGLASISSKNNNNNDNQIVIREDTASGAWAGPLSGNSVEDREMEVFRDTIKTAKEINFGSNGDSSVSGKLGRQSWNWVYLSYCHGVRVQHKSTSSLLITTRERRKDHTFRRISSRGVPDRQWSTRHVQLLIQCVGTSWR